MNELNVLFTKLKEVISSVLPITVIVTLLNFTLTPLPQGMFYQFLVGAAIVILGLAIFLFGVDLGITPIGESLGMGIARSNKVWIVIVAGLILGFFISVAEPDLHILAEQVSQVTGGIMAKMDLVLVVSLGVAVLVATGLIRIVFNYPLYKLLTFIYLLIFILALFVSPDMLAVAFDSSGATTGAMTVPFILALSLGVSMLKKDSKASEKDSFGLVAIASGGAILGVLVMSIIRNSGLDPSQTNSMQLPDVYDGVLTPFISKLPVVAGEVLLALMPILITFLFYQAISLKLPGRQFRHIMFGLLFTLIGLILFLLGVNAGFMEVGRSVGAQLAKMHPAYVVITGFILGSLTILAEPAVSVLTHQIEDVTTGYVKRSVVLATLALGVGISVALSMTRILIPGLQLWHFLLPGYSISIVLMYFVPKLFVGIAFDSGGVASGPMTASFILAFSQGAASAIEGANVMIDGFGVIAMVAMAPLIALQILGMVFRAKSRKAGISL